MGDGSFALLDGAREVLQGGPFRAASALQSPEIIEILAEGKPLDRIKYLSVTVIAVVDAPLIEFYNAAVVSSAG